MARKRKLTDEVIQAIAQRRKEGASYEMLEREFGVSRGSVANALKASRGGKTAKQLVASKPSTVTKRELKSTDPHDPNRELRKLLEETVPNLDAMAKMAHANGEAGTYKSLVGQMTSTIEKIVKMRPPPPPDHEHAPNMVAAAQKARDGFERLMARALAKLDEGDAA